MLSLKIDNPEIENRFKQYAKKHNKNLDDVANEAMNLFFEFLKQDDELIYVKRDPMKHLRNTIYIDDDEDLSDVKPYAHIEDSALYIHNLRKKKR